MQALLGLKTLASCKGTEMTVALLQQVKTASKPQYKTSIGTTQAVRVRGLGDGHAFSKLEGRDESTLDGGTA